jgi:hypothetical protein
MSDIIIHIGLPKTATSYLQADVFPFVEDLHLLRGWKSIRKMLSVYNKTILISDESLSGSLYSGDWRNDFSAKIKLIKTTFNNPKIIIGFREQKGFILSSYKQYLHQKGTKDFNSFYNIENTGLIKIEDLIYESMIEELKLNFNEIFIYTLDLIKNDFQLFFDQFSEFSGVPKVDVKSFTSKHRNVGVKTIKEIELLIKTNKLNNKLDGFLYSPIFKKLKITPLQIILNGLPFDNSPDFKMPDEVNQFVSNHYKNDWTNISNMVNVKCVE